MVSEKRTLICKKRGCIHGIVIPNWSKSKRIVNRWNKQPTAGLSVHPSVRPSRFGIKGKIITCDQMSEINPNSVPMFVYQNGDKEMTASISSKLTPASTPTAITELLTYYYSTFTTRTSRSVFLSLSQCHVHVRR